ncbi:energy transducer TonB [Paraburkholderia antibiotica]|uniref:TonB C-terminal domain-containing protein n=1 Tax=Paraburkholderia antibiotica TaxID=2728839 RepID=A0A7X9ZVN7_9BURK|nr:energy transducer TonB [Paraburkholderia antibiotica]NML30112.1 TonB C-terminal domain-containing protein [Paraburkholderia antibiotica]
MKKYARFATCLSTLSFSFPFALACAGGVALLAGCAGNSPTSADLLPARPAQEVLDRCLAGLAPAGTPPPSAQSLDESQWRRYVACAIGSNLHAARDQVSDNPEAIVEVRVEPDGMIGSIRRVGSSGNAAWDRAVDRSIGATPALQPAPAGHQVARMELHFRPFKAALGMNSAGGLSDESHWSWHRCITVHGTAACN